tara:strand:- start:2449 stop:2646 length:198 start_codon:yes stop_codon:yes gene_type:complete
MNNRYEELSKVVKEGVDSLINTIASNNGVSGDKVLSLLEDLQYEVRYLQTEEFNNNNNGELNDFY